MAAMVGWTVVCLCDCVFVCVVAVISTSAGMTRVSTYLKLTYFHLIKILGK
jgi:hypothetical protein